jgi:BRCT domain type II-containing protein
MNVSEITTRVADLIRNPDSAMPNEWEHSIQKKQTQAPETTEISKPKPAAPKAEPKPATSKAETSTVASSGEYTLALSPLAQKILEEADSHESEWEKKRSENVQRIQQLVHEKQYHLAPEIVDGIARKIVDMLH